MNVVQVTTLRLPEFFSSPMDQVTHNLNVNLASSSSQVDVSVCKTVHSTFVEHGAASSRAH